VKRIARVLALAALSTIALSAHAEKIGVAMSAFDDNWLTILRQSISNRASQVPEVSVQFEDAQTDVGRQLSQIQNFIAQKVDAIIVNAVDTDATPKITKMVTAAGIPLVYVNRVPSDKVLPPKVGFVGSRDYEAGTLEMTEVCKQLGGKGNILVMVGDLANQSARERTQAIKDVISKAPCKDIKIADERTAGWMRTNAVDLMTNWLSAGIKFDAVVANNDEMALGAIQALKAAHKMNKQIIVAGVDGTSDAFAAMKAGDLRVTVYQDAVAQGKDAVDEALKIIKGQKTESMVWVPFGLVTQANLSQYIAKN
jgi:inositol transport system substrate-binding protein